jgi:hypothetical protein
MQPPLCTIVDEEVGEGEICTVLELWASPLWSPCTALPLEYRLASNTLLVDHLVIVSHVCNFSSAASVRISVMMLCTWESWGAVLLSYESDLCMVKGSASFVSLLAGKCFPPPTTAAPTKTSRAVADMACPSVVAPWCPLLHFRFFF